MPKKPGESRKEFEKKRMHDFKTGNMHSRVKGTGPVVSNPKQAVAIMLSEEGLSKKKKRKKRK